MKQKLDEIVMEDELQNFLENNDFTRVKHKEVAREILILCKIYNNNFDRIKAEDNPLKKITLRHIEDHLNKASIYMREYIGIRSHPRSDHRRYETPHNKTLANKEIKDGICQTG